MPKPLKPHGNGNGLRATNIGFRPGDFPLGSPESRAVVRAMLESERELTDYDRDCLLVYLANYYSPRYRDVAETEVGKRGHEVYEIIHGPIISAYEDPFEKARRNYQGSTTAYGIFHLLHRELPKHGDTLRYEEIQEVFNPQAQEQRIQQMQEAWARRLPEFPCPVKFEQGRILKRFLLDHSRPKEELWDDAGGVDFQIWAEIEAEANGNPHAPEATEPRPPAFGAVVFREGDQGQFQVKPLKTLTR